MRELKKLTPMDGTTFGSDKQFKSLGFIMDRVNEIMNPRHRNKISRYLHNLNKDCNQLKLLKTTNHYLYMVKSAYSVNVDLFAQLLISEYERKMYYLNYTDNGDTRFDAVLMSYIRNYTLTKVKVSIE